MATVFYKYTTQTTAESILKNGRLRWSSPVIFNDLAEFQRMPRFEPTVNEAHRLFPQVLIDAANGRLKLDMMRLAPATKLLLVLIRHALLSGKAGDQLLGLLRDFERSDADEYVEQGLRDYFQSLDPRAARVLCLTSTFDNEVMWGTYADNHFGCALGFTAALADSPFHQARPVAYSDKPPIAGSGLDFLLYGDSPELRRKTIDAVFYTKKLVWSYEQEWRLITWRPEEAEVLYGDYILKPEELVSVTFGARAKTEFIESVRDVAKNRYKNLSFFQITQQKGELRRGPLFK